MWREGPRGYVGRETTRGLFCLYIVVWEGKLVYRGRFSIVLVMLLSIGSCLIVEGEESLPTFSNRLGVLVLPWGIFFLYQL